ncbi:DUF1493 family protein [Flavobacterium eburneipallidum]|uniref:DUF1493 family protein n=1 Tax=Flavobacterium eburneipallidum TaxID=3003263 RepID=UPI002482752E|nr:DUF1493 family protein [Flavobacterium eburneipallidum]
MKTIIKISFKNLKQNYLEVQQYLEEKSGEKKISNKSKIANDLGFLGDDNCYLLEDFITKYGVDFSNFNYDEYFESEGELFGSSAVLLKILILPLFIIKFVLFLLIKPFSKEHSSKINNFNFFLKKFQSDRIDLTMGDLITSKIQGKFYLRENVTFDFS